MNPKPNYNWANLTQISLSSLNSNWEPIISSKYHATCCFKKLRKSVIGFLTLDNSISINNISSHANDTSGITFCAFGYKMIIWQDWDLGFCLSDKFHNGSEPPSLKREQIVTATGRGDEPPALTVAAAVQLQSSGIWLTFWDGAENCVRDC